MKKPAARFGRRTALLHGAALSWACTRPRVNAPPSPVAPLACVLTPEQVEGPYYLDDARIRRDLREGKPGVPLSLTLTLLDVRTCRPLQGAAVDLWHCDAVGVYSGFTAESRRPLPPGGPGPWGGPGPSPGGPGPGPPHGRGGPDGLDGPPKRATRGDALTYLRGIQLSEADGTVDFETVYPGWYPGRAIHLHLLLRTGGAVTGRTYEGGHVAHTGQLYLDENESDQVLSVAPYNGRTGTRMLQREDFIFRHGGSAGLVELTRVEARNVGLGYRARVAVALDPSASPPRQEPPSPRTGSSDKDFAH